jgi:DNA-3-methyladenine glycosylase
LTFPPLSFFNLPAEDLAIALLGQELQHKLPSGEIRSGLITEVEAYLQQNDAASHHFRAKPAALRALSMGPGTLYIHPMRAYIGLDIVAKGGSVLIRTLLPMSGLENPQDTQGPGKLCRAMGITKAHYGLNVSHPQSPIRILTHAPTLPEKILKTPRIGITQNTEAPLRFVVK